MQAYWYEFKGITHLETKSAYSTMVRRSPIEREPTHLGSRSKLVMVSTQAFQFLRHLAELAYDVFLESGILIQPVPIALGHWLNPERYPRPGFLRNVARELVAVEAAKDVGYSKDAERGAKQDQSHSIDDDLDN